MTPGSTCALVTPYTASGKIDVPALRNLLRFHVENGTDGLCILGTTGEAAVMSMEERATVLTTAVEEVKGKIPILAGTGTIDPVHVKEMTLQAIDIGCGVGGPMRNIQEFTGSHITGVTINEYQVKVGNQYCQEKGIADKCRVAQGDF